LIGELLTKGYNTYYTELDMLKGMSHTTNCGITKIVMSEQCDQIARTIYHRWMSTMKYALELEEFSYREKGRLDPRYKTFKKHLMSNTYSNIRSLFEDLQKLGIIDKTDYEEDVKNGYTESNSGGSGYINSPEFDDWLKG